MVSLQHNFRHQVTQYERLTLLLVSVVEMFTDSRVAQQRPLCHGGMWTAGFGTRAAEGAAALQGATNRKQQQM